MSRSVAACGISPPGAGAHIGPPAPLYFSALTAPERSVVLMATFNLDAVATVVTRAKPWVCGVFNTVARYNRSATQLIRSQARYATKPLTTAPADTPANTPIDGRLSPFDLTRSVQYEGGGLIAPVAESAIGTLFLQNADGALDYLDDEAAVVGREIELSAAPWTGTTVTGTATTAGVAVFEVGVFETGAFDAGADSSFSVLDSFGPIYNGVVEAIGWDRGAAQLTVRDFRLKLQQPVQKSIYTGNGGVGGGAELANVSKPYALGNCRNVRPTLIDAAKQLYQVHDGEMRAIDAVYDMGVPLTILPEIISLSALTELVSADSESDGDIPLGSVAPCPVAGCFRLGGIPAGTVTADVRGAGGADTLRETFSDGTLFTDGTGFRSAALVLYSRTAGMIIERLLINAGFTDHEIALNQIAQMDLERPREVGIYLAAGEQRTVAEVVGLCARSMGCILIRPTDGRYQLREVVPPREAAVIAVNIEAQDQGKLTRQPLPYRQPWSDVDIVYNRNWTPMKDSEVAGSSDFAGAVPPERRNLLTREFLVSRSTSAELAAVYPERAPLRIETALINDGDAQALGQQLLAFHARGRQQFSVSIRGAFYRLELMDTIRLIAPRFGLDAGKNLLVISVRESGVSLATDLVLFG